MLLALLLAARGLGQPTGPWMVGRATYYGTDAWSIHKGSCGYGTIYQDEPLGWNVAAMPDTAPGYADSCGRCVEVMCDPSVIRDNYGGSFDRTQACYDSSASLVVRIVDTCPCTYPDNAYSNKRWCCEDQPHLDLSIWAWERLADTKYGVMGLKYRTVPCDYQPQKTAALAPKPSDAGYIPQSRRIPRDWPEYWPNSVTPNVIYQGGFASPWDASASYRTSFDYNSVPSMSGSGRALCATIQPKGALSFKMPSGAMENRIALIVWLYVGQVTGADTPATQAMRNVMVVPRGPQGDCQPVNLINLLPTGFEPTCTYCTDYFWRFEVFLSAFAGFGPTSVINNAQFFKGCGNNDVGELSNIDIRNFNANPQTVCLDHLQLQ